MKCRKLITILIACVVAVVLNGCNDEEILDEIGSEIWQQWPEITEGIFTGTPLECLQWNCGRLEATSENRMAETSRGYYLVHEGYLYYADKNNLAVWVPVCNQPDCEHFGNEDLDVRCNAKIASSGIVIKNDRIFALVNASDYPELYDGNYTGKLLIEFKPNGTERKLAFVPDAKLFPRAITEESVFNEQHWLYHVEELSTDGVIVSHLFRISESGIKEVATQSGTEGGSFTTFSTPTRIAYGVNVFQYGPMGHTGSIWGLYQGETYRTLDLSKLPSVGCYVYGNVARGFSIAEGYHDVNLETGVHTKLADARMGNSRARVILPNCIIESTLFDSGNPNIDDNCMELYDGESWKNVEIPDELKKAKNVSVTVLGVASDRIFIEVRNGIDYYNNFKISIYCISLCADEIKMQYCTDIEPVVPSV